MKGGRKGFNSQDNKNHPMNDLSGQTRDRLTVIRPDYYTVKGKAGIWYYLCQCSCGNTKSLSSLSLNSTITKVKSCGCAKAEATSKRVTTHGDSGKGKRKRLFSCHRHMLQRCSDGNASDYKYYGGRGITVCEEWLPQPKGQGYINFRDWAFANGWTGDDCKLEIDRIDVNGNYCPENCRFVTRTQNIRNTRRNKMLEYNGETLSFAEIVERFAITGLSYQIVYDRIHVLGWELHEALTTSKTESYKIGPFIKGERKRKTDSKASGSEA